MIQMDLSSWCKKVIRMIEVKDIAWLAGIIEGEGSFLTCNTTPCISLQMTDKDIVERAARLLGVSVGGPYGPYGYKGAQPTWTCRAHGQRAAGWIMTLWTFMGTRRREKMLEVLEAWKVRKTSRRNRPPGRKATCHPEREHRAHGLCGPCYRKQYRASHPDYQRQWRAKRRAAQLV